MKYLKTFEDYKFKSDEDIHKEYSNFELESVKFEIKKIRNSFTYESLFEWKFKNDEGDDQVTTGGFSSSVEYPSHTIIPDENGKCYFSYKVENWYPDSVYDKMVDIIKEKLQEKYDCEFEKLDFLDFFDKIENMEVKKTDKEIENYKKNKK